MTPFTFLFLTIIFVLLGVLYTKLVIYATGLMLLCTYIAHFSYRPADLFRPCETGASHSGDYDHSILVCDAVKSGNDLQAILLNVRKFLPNYTSPCSTRRKYCIHRIYHRTYSGITYTSLILVYVFRATILHIQISVAKLLHKVHICY
jgi:hypothetical protein